MRRFFFSNYIRLSVQYFFYVFGLFPTYITKSNTLLPRHFSSKDQNQTFINKGHNTQPQNHLFQAHNSIWPSIKREGRQHGMVRTYRILPSPLNQIPETRFVNRFDSATTAAGLFTRVSSRQVWTATVQWLSLAPGVQGQGQD